MRAFFLSCLLLLGVQASALAAKPDALPREVVINGVEFVLIPEGWFYYTADRGMPGGDVRSGEPWFREVRVWLDGFYMAKYEARARDLTRFFNSGQSRHIGQYAGRKTGCAVRQGRDGAFFEVDEEQDLPATHLSWYLADEFARWMGFRLPSDMEWQKAARGTDRRFWPWGDDYPDDTYGGFLASASCNPTPVDAFPKGRSPYGIYNMAGNVLEFVADWYNAAFDDSIVDGIRNPPLAKEGSLRREITTPVKILKGGRWASSPGTIAIRARHREPPGTSFVCYGARFAVDLQTVRAHLEKGTAKVVVR